MGQTSVLVIHESAAVRQQICFVLSHQGFEIVEVPNLGSGIRYLRDEPVCLIIADNTLPGFSVPHFLHEIRELPGTGSVPILLLNKEGMDNPYSESHLAYLMKPFSYDSLTATVHRILAKPA